MKIVPYKVLIIDDSNDINQTIGEWIKDIAEVVTVSDVSQDSKILLTIPWDVVITDLAHSALNDLDVTDLVKKSMPQSSVFIVTSGQKVNFILSAMQNHADALMFKPLDKDEFMAQFHKLAQAARDRWQKEKKTILAIGSHPDDVEFGCGGNLLLHLSKGDALNILTLSSGENGGNPKTRISESEQSAAMLGARLFWGRLSDTKIVSTAKTITMIQKVVDECEPTHVYVHSPHDSHQDHRNSYLATVTACRQVPNLYCYMSPSSTVDFRPNLFVNIDEVMEQKIHLITLFDSQFKLRPYLQPDLIRAIARYWGIYSSFSLVEPLEVVKQQYL